MNFRNFLISSLVMASLVTLSFTTTVASWKSNGFFLRTSSSTAIWKAGRRTPLRGSVHVDHYGRTVPKPAHGSVNLGKYTSSSKLILKAMTDLYERITNPALLVRRVTVTASHVIREEDIPKPEEKPEQFDLFTDYEAVRQEREQTVKEERKEKSLQHAMIAIKHKFGKNAILKGSNLQEGAMTIERNQQIGGHHE